MSERKSLTFLLVLGVGSAALYAALYLRLGPARDLATFSERIIAYPILFVAYFAACCLLGRRGAQVSNRRAAVAVIGFAALFRVIVLCGPAWNNVDTWRYLWEGRVVLAGMNPYAAAPDSSRYDNLRRALHGRGDDLFEHVPRKWNHIRSVYGPVAAAVFTLPHLLPFDRPWSVRLLMAAFDFATALVITALLQALRRPPALALVYAWNPLCLDSFAERGHVDAAMVLCLAVALYLLARKRLGWAGVAFAASVMVKISPLILLPVFARKGRAGFAAVFAATAAVGAIPYVCAGSGSLSGYRDFYRGWSDNGSAHALVAWALGSSTSSAGAVATAKAVVLVAAIGYAVWRAFAGDSRDPTWLFGEGAAVVGVGLLLAPVSYPWYAVQLLPFICVVPNVGWLLLTCTTMSWYIALWIPPTGSFAARLLGQSPRWTQPWRWLTYPPVYALVVWEAWRQRRSRAGGGGPWSTSAELHECASQPPTDVGGIGGDFRAPRFSRPGGGEGDEGD